jgi:preprotein translocase subunit SecB
MQKAKFQLLNYQFNKVYIDVSNHADNDLVIAFDTSGVFNTAESTYNLSFDVKVSNNSPEQPYVNITCSGVFKFENVISIEEIPEFFYKNSIAILFPYVRAYLSLVTTQAQVPGILLPTYNLSHLEGGLKNNTTTI